jgi:hypothetical protein
VSFRRLAILGLVLAGALVAPATALADNSLSITGATLGPQGASAVVSVDYSCNTDIRFGVIQVIVAQSTGNKLATGNNSLGPLLDCDNATHTAQIRVDAFPPFPFKQGKVAVTAIMMLTDNNDQFSSVTAGPQDVPIKK